MNSFLVRNPFRRSDFVYVQSGPKRLQRFFINFGTQQNCQNASHCVAVKVAVKVITEPKHSEEVHSVRRENLRFQMDKIRISIKE